MPHEEIVAVYRGERFRREDWAIGNGVDESGKAVALVGNSDPGEIAWGRRYRFFGRRITHPKFGEQFEYDSFAEYVGLDHAGVVEYLVRQCRGIGPTSAEKLWRQYQSEAVSVLREDPERVIDETGLGIDTIRQASAVLREANRFESTKIELMGLIAGKGFPRATIKAAIHKWQGKAAEMVRRDFRLLTAGFRGIGFTRSDEFYAGLGFRPDRLRRQTLFVWHKIKSDTGGNSWFPRADLEHALSREVRGANTDRAVTLGLRAGWLAEYVDERGARWLTANERASDEARISARIAAMQTNATSWPHDVPGISEHQADRLRLATMGPVGILTGCPGTGKTYTLAALIQAMSGSRQIFACAPTGKAAVRVTETLGRYGIMLAASTIHRLLGFGPGGGFAYRRDNPLPAGVLVVDESSMVSSSLMADLLDACPDRMLVLLVGDPYQLAPVGHGAPLRDLIAAGLPHGELSEIRRNAGRIVETCHAMRNNRPWNLAEKLDLDAGVNLAIVRANHPSVQIEKLLERLKEIRAEHGPTTLARCQILVTVNDKSPIGRKDLNRKLQPFFNPSVPAGEIGKIHVGDKVICTDNSHMRQMSGATAEPDDIDEDEDGNLPVDLHKDRKAFVSNGDIGFVVEMQGADAVVEFVNPGRTVVTPARGPNCVIDLAYAITTWKSQGSEWPIVLAMADSSAGANWVGSCELWYTAISRASTYCLVFGEPDTVRRQCRRWNLSARKTFLREQTGAAIEAVLEGVEV